MLIELKEILQLEEFKHFKLLNKGMSIEGFVGKIGILDYETPRQIDETFDPGDFVITTLLAYKDNIDGFFEPLKELVKKGVGALAIKDIYFESLPDYMVEFCTEQALPVFVFTKTYFEDIVTIVDKVVKNGDINQVKIDKLNLILYGEYSNEKVRDIARSINRNFFRRYMVFYCNKINKDSLDYFFANDLIGTSYINYGKDLIIIYSRDNLDENPKKPLVETILRTTGVDCGNYHIGYSNVFDDLGELNYSVRQAKAAYRFCRINDREMEAFDKLGVDRFILTNDQNYWLEQFSDSILKKISSWDSKATVDIESTIKYYVLSGGDIKKTANLMSQHENTIRYRLEKMRKILGFRGTDMEFFSQISLAYRIYISKNKGYL